jgi:carbonic anhydrase/acetyltransferase-like protein (isoleucine patch superfamily)
MKHTHANTIFDDNLYGCLREKNSNGHYPEVAATAFVHHTATLIGRVCVGDGAFIGPHAVIRADEAGPDGNVQPIIIGECANVQDGVVIHALGGTAVFIGPNTSIAHSAVIHGPCKIGAGCFVGFNSVVFQATLGDGVVVMHLAVVENAVVTNNLLIPSMTAVRCNENVRNLKRVTPDVVAFVKKVSTANELLAKNALKSN